jgi:isocitrate dehydrogenase
VFCVEFFLESPGVYLATKEPTHGPAQDHFGQTATANETCV